MGLKKLSMLSVTHCTLAIMDDELNVRYHFEFRTQQQKKVFMACFLIRLLCQAGSV
jgi:hypothetical protein